jgi:Zn-finger nucleic acid-binding protein
MKCPTCGVELQRGQIDSVVVDECPRCNGAWFDGGELRMHQDRF